MTLLPLFHGLPRRLELEAATVGEAIADLDERWPGLRDRLCEPGPPLSTCGRTSMSTSTASGPGSEPSSDARSRVDVIAAISGG